MSKSEFPSCANNQTEYCPDGASEEVKQGMQLYKNRLSARDSGFGHPLRVSEVGRDD
jgi:hypothetical protein